MLLMVLRHYAKSPYRRGFQTRCRKTPESVLGTRNVVDGSPNNYCPYDGVMGYIRRHAPFLIAVRPD